MSRAPRAPLPFTQAAISRAVKGAKAAGCEVQRVEARKDGTIVVVTKSGCEAEEEPSSPTGEVEENEWDGAE